MTHFDAYLDALIHCVHEGNVDPVLLDRIQVLIVSEINDEGAAADPNYKPVTKVETKPLNPFMPISVAIPAGEEITYSPPRTKEFDVHIDPTPTIMPRVPEPTPKWTLPKVIASSEASHKHAKPGGSRSNKTEWPCSCGCGTTLYLWPFDLRKKPNGPFYLNRQHAGVGKSQLHGKVKPALKNLCYMCTVVGQCGNPQNCEANPPTAIDTPNPDPHSTGVILVPSSGLKLHTNPEPKLCLEMVTDHTICSLSPNHYGDHADRQGNVRGQQEEPPKLKVAATEISGEARGQRYIGMRAPETAPPPIALPSSGMTGQRCPKCHGALFLDGDDKDREYCFCGFSRTKIPDAILKEVADRGTNTFSGQKRRSREPSHGGLRI